MNEYAQYVRRLEQLARLQHVGSMTWQAQVIKALNGEASKELRRCFSWAEIRSSGTFFTGSELAEKLIGRFLDTQQRIILDPACGAGDLLLAAASQLPVYESLVKTLSIWSNSLAGHDIRDEFVRVARARLILLAMTRGARLEDGNLIDLEHALPMITVGDGLSDLPSYGLVDLVLLNPPFHLMQATTHCTWATGKVTAASLFVEKALQAMKNGAELAAILPDVLRSGSRYEKWRQCIQHLGRVVRVIPYGLFGATADVDVFLLYMKKEQTRSHSFWLSRSSGRKASRGTVGERFMVRVGSIVPYRDKGSGPKRFFIHARGLPKWCTFSPSGDKRRCDGPTFCPPFVVVRRTSRPGDKKRATSTIIAGERDVYVENHLLVLHPRDGSLSQCRQLLRRLKSQKTDAWLDKRIRCRHLTVSALAELPWWK